MGRALEVVQRMGGSTYFIWEELWRLSADVRGACAYERELVADFKRMRGQNIWDGLRCLLGKWENGVTFE
jgi:hypothetical protein